jgi:hypothetical protein
MMMKSGITEISRILQNRKECHIMSKIVFNASRSNEELQAEKQLSDNTGLFLKSNLRKILDKKQLILNTEELFFSDVGYMRFGFKYFVDDLVNLPMGILIKLWENGSLIKPCNKCTNGNAHIYIWRAFIGYQQHCHYKAVCDCCKEINDVDMPQMDDFRDKFEHVKEIVKKNRNVEIKNIIKPGAPQHFSWSKGLVPEIPEISEIIKPKAIPVDREMLIKVLNGQRLKRPHKVVPTKQEQQFHPKPKVMFSSQKGEGLINIS